MNKIFFYPKKMHKKNTKNLFLRPSYLQTQFKIQTDGFSFYKFLNSLANIVSKKKVRKK